MIDDNSVLLILGVLSGLLSTIAYVPYVLDTLKRRTAPDRACWLIWSTLGSIAFFSQVYEGATSSLWFAGVQVSGTIVVFLLSVRYGAGEYFSMKNQTILLIAASGIVTWYFTENAAYALAITISVSLLGGMVTVQKAFFEPDSETLSTWLISLSASACAVLSVGKYDWTLLAYPLYLLALYTAIVTAMMFGRMRKLALARAQA